MKEKQLKPYFNGIPTSIDVEKLTKKFGIPEEGKLIAYGEIEDVIGSPYGGNRFRSVTNAWRKKLERESNVMMIACQGDGFVHADPSRRLDKSSRKAKSGTKAIIVAGERARRNNASRLNEEERRVNDSIVNFSSAVQLASITEAKKLKWPVEQKKIA